MKLFIGCDHAAYEAKEELKHFLEEMGHELRDVGCYNSNRCNYPEYATALVDEMTKKGLESVDVKGILMCGSGIGVSMVANKYRGIRAALCRSSHEAELSRQHNDANVLCLGARINTMDELKVIVTSWLSSSFEGGRHLERIEMFKDLGQQVRSRV